MKTPRTRNLLMGLALPLLVAGCSGPPDRVGPADESIRESKGALIAELNTFITQYIDIDDTDYPVTPGDPDSPEDANLVLGADSDGAVGATTEAPAPITATSPQWWDWNELYPDKDNHFIYDLDDPDSGKDPSAFPRKEPCVGNANVLSKMDLVYVGVANNVDYAYFSVARSDNSGDAGYYWILSKQAPSNEEDLTECNVGETYLKFDIRKGDFLLAGHFKPSSDLPLLTIYEAQKDADNVPANGAIDFLDTTLWLPKAGAVEAVAVNTTPTNPAALGTDGFKQIQAGKLKSELFAEAAIRTSVFTNGSICGAQFFGTVITRSSGAGGNDPDLKDMVGPRRLRFGDVSGAANLTPSCDPQLGYSASLTGINGQPVANPSCKWTFSDGAVIDGPCSGNRLALTPGTYNASVEIKDPATTCATEVKDLTVLVADKVGVTPTLTGSCTDNFTYGATNTGGSSTNPDDYGYSWSFTPGASSNPSSSTSRSGTVNVTSTPTEYTGEVTITDPRTDISCSAKASAKAWVYSPLAVSLTPSATAASCQAGSLDAITYTAVPSGGSGNYAVGWTLDGGFSCVNGTNCTVDPSNDVFCADVNLHATLTDTVAASCAGVDSETETYHKQTAVSSTNN